MRTSFQEIRNEKLKGLRSLLIAWHNIHKTYSNVFTKDSLYWYNERANISVLAGAAWKCAAVCLEEFGSIKKHPEKFWATGRSDLWFRHKGVEYYVEAKQIDLSITQPSRLATRRKKIRKAIDAARKDAAKVKRDRNGAKPEGQKLGIVFIVPYLVKTDSVDKRIEDFLHEIAKEKFDIMAYAFPEKHRMLKYKDYICPGVVMLGRVPKR